MTKLKSLLAFFGFLSLFNIVAHYQTAFDLAASLVWLAEWWHYLTSFLFWPLPFAMPLWEKDLLVVLITLGAFGFRRIVWGMKKGNDLPLWDNVKLASEMVTSSAEEFEEESKPKALVIHAMVGVSGLYWLSFLWRLFTTTPSGTVAFLVLIFVFLVSTFARENLRVHQKIDLGIVYCLVGPALTTNLLLTSMFRSWRAVLKFALAFLVVLVGAVLVGEYLDPLILDRLEGLPRAPNV
ncbi:hypothetical protein [Pontixanthobacter sp. CEM42]|uniref:hypothetical protein n=1 Tax=Pontixanthobacter sp. CEM42 TaxID=2792077 RepID=UPI001AE09C01|nr:hypothetical protein [Pontixanthobacter sp. CEM42]